MGYYRKKYAIIQETILFFTKNKTNYTFNADDIRTPYDSKDRMKYDVTKGILKNGKVQKLPHLIPKYIDMIEKIIKASYNKN